MKKKTAFFMKKKERYPSKKEAQAMKKISTKEILEQVDRLMEGVEGWNKFDTSIFRPLAYNFKREGCTRKSTK